MDFSELEQAAVRYLAGREHSREELRRKLLTKCGDQSLVNRLLEDLARRRLQSDERFVEQYVAQRSRKGYGPVRIRQELRQRGIAGELIDRWLDASDPVWEERLGEVVRGKFGNRPAADFKERARRARFLEYRGFPSERIRAFLWSEE